MADIIKVLLVEDHAIVRAGMRMLLESNARIQVVGEAADRSSALKTAAAAGPDIILLDIDLSGRNSLDFLPELISVAGDARVIMVTGMYDVDQHQRAVRFGASGLVTKDQASEVLLKAIEKVHAGEIWLDRSMISSVLGQMARGHKDGPADPEADKIASLTDREREVVVLICQGLQNKTIGDQLGITENTVRHHLSSIFSKLGVASRLELVIYAYRHKLSKLFG